MKSKLLIQNYASGFTLLELLVSLALGGIILGLTAGTVVGAKKMYKRDALRTRINQDLRSSIDLIGTNIRIAGENLDSPFPAVEVIDGANGAPDQLILRRNTQDEVLKVCSPINSGTTTAVTFANGAQAGCSYSDNTHNFNTWKDLRLSENGQIWAYIFDSASKAGEYFLYSNETDSGTEYSLQRSGGTWNSDYSASASAVYIIEEWKFQMNQDLLQVVLDSNEAEPLNISYGLKDFQVQIELRDGAQLSEFDQFQDWTQIKHIQISLNAEAAFEKKTIKRSLSAKFFPRNVLSN